MKKLFTAMMLMMVAVLSGHAFTAGTTYYVDMTATDWFSNNSAVLKVVAGSNYVVANGENAPIYSFTLTEDADKVKLYRSDPNNITGSWNEGPEVSSPTGNQNCYSIGNGFSAGSWNATPYDPSSQPTTKPAWIISKNANSWSGSSMGDYVMDYNEATEIYTITIDAGKLRASESDGNGFKIGYNQAINNWNLFWGAPNNAKTLENGVATTAQQSSDSKNFMIAADVTGNVVIEFSATAKTVKATWETGDTPGPVDPEPEVTDGLKAGQTYYIDATDCDWFFNGSAVFFVNDGTNKIACENNNPILSFVAVKDCAKFDILRCDPKDTSNAWNSMKDIDATKIGTNNCYKINDNFSSGSFTTYTPEEEPAVLPAWIISKEVNGWAGNAISDVTMAYDEATKLYTATVDAAKLRATDGGNGFKIGYKKAANDWNLFWGAPDADKTLENGVAATTAQGSDTKNFIIADDVEGNVTIVFSAEAKTVTASWTVNEDPEPNPNPEPADDTLVVTVPVMDVNGEATVEVKLNAAEGKEYVSGQWNIEVPAGFSVSNIALNEAVCPDHALLTNTVDGVIKCIAYSAQNTAIKAAEGAMFTFTLKATDAAAGTANGTISGIRFNVAPTADNTNIAYLFEDAEIAITTVKAVKTITATPNAIALNVGGTQAIELTINPEDATDATVTWTITEGEEVISLVDGVVTALAEGSAVIKVVANDGFGAETTINVTVDGKPVTAIVLDATEKTLYAGESFTLVATVTPDDATNTGVNWTSDNEAVATVDEYGVVTAIAAGEATITATAKDGSGVSASCTVTVKARISGDADGDDNLTIMDIVIIAKAAIGITTEGMHEENMDLDGDGVYTSTDVTMAVSYLMQLDFQALPAYAEVSTDMLKVSTPTYTENGEMMLPIYLNGATSVAGIQFDVVLPNALELGENSYVEPAASNGHLMQFTKIADNTYRLVIYSANNFRGNELGYINVRPSTIQRAPGMTDTKMDIDLNNVMYSDGVSLKATDNTRTTLDLSGIEAVFAANGGVATDIYNVKGMLVARQADAAAISTLPAGIYVMNGKKVVKF